MHAVATAVAIALAACDVPPPVSSIDAPAPSPAPTSNWQPTAFSVEVRGHGRPVILIPGLGCPGSVWRDTVAHLEGYETHVLTLAGFAGRSRIAAPLAATTRDELVRYVRDRHLDAPIVIGHSMGGLIAYWLAAQAPDRVGAAIVIDSGAVVGGDGRDANAASAAQARDMWKYASDDAYVQLVHDAFGSMLAKPARLAPYLDDIAASDRGALGDAIYELASIDLRPELPNVRAPVLALLADGGNQDAYRRQAEAVHDHTVVVVPGSGHFVMLDDPSATYAAIDNFLTAHNARQASP